MKSYNIDGEIYPHVVNPDNLRSAKQYVPHGSDVFVCTFPRSGTTWIQHIAHNLCSKNTVLMLERSDQSNKIINFEIIAELCITSPLIEYRGVDFVNTLEHPRLLKTHFTYWNCPKSQDAKYIYVVRNPKDVLTSYYFHHKNFKLLESSDVDFDSFSTYS
uniref:Sulfotransferase domain-containing protein n=1 Tax=Ditylenchus dipsaci TaxID=166011 RepID=A0A915D7Y0_9BILA